MKSLRQIFRLILRYPSAAAGLTIIATLVGVSIYAVIAIPHIEAIRLWRGGEEIWIENPKLVPPKWVNLFSRTRLPETLVISSEDSGSKKVHAESKELLQSEITLKFDYNYDAFPKELNIFLKGKFQQKKPVVTLFWITPDGREIKLKKLTISESSRYSVSLDSRLSRQLGGLDPERGLFADPTEESKRRPLKGRYKLVAKGWLFEKDSNVDVKLIVYGKVHGLAGTDHRRRDIMIGLLWGTPIALVFGILAAVGSTLSTFVIAAIGVWYGGSVDALIQRITEVNLILPVLPILILVGTFYSRSIWLMLGVLIALGIFSPQIKTYRAMFLQVRDSPFIEAARAYGASNFRIIFFYLIPKVIPVLVPSLVILIPYFVFIEASLAVLGLGDPLLPTWGKVLNDAYRDGALYKGYYYWMLEPAVLLMLTGLGFTMVGFTLDRIFNPRLREL